MRFDKPNRSTILDPFLMSENSSSQNGGKAPSRSRGPAFAIAGLSGAAAAVLGALGAHGAVADHLAARAKHFVTLLLGFIALLDSAFVAT